MGRWTLSFLSLLCLSLFEETLTQPTGHNVTPRHLSPYYLQSVFSCAVSDADQIRSLIAENEHVDILKVSEGQAHIRFVGEREREEVEGIRRKEEAGIERREEEAKREDVSAQMEVLMRYFSNCTVLHGTHVIFHSLLICFYMKKK